MLRVSSGIFPLTPSGFNVRNPLVKVGRVKFCRTYEGIVFGNSISDPSVILFERDSMETKVPKRQPGCHPRRWGPAGLDREELQLGLPHLGVLPDDFFRKHKRIMVSDNLFLMCCKIGGQNIHERVLGRLKLEPAFFLFVG